MLTELNHPSKFRAKHWVEINKDARETYNTNSQIKFNTLMLKSSLCDYSDPYMLVSGPTTVAAQAGNNPNNGDKEVVFKNCAPFADCISEINNTQIDNAVHSLIKYSDHYWKTSTSLWQYYGDEPASADADAIANFNAANSSGSFKFLKEYNR